LPVTVTLELELLMAPPLKRKRKPLPKRACPCCSAVLSEKTIERHLGGTYVPNRIKITRAAASSQHRARSSYGSKNNSGSISSNSSEGDSSDRAHYHSKKKSGSISSDSSEGDSSDAESTKTASGTVEIGNGAIERPSPLIEHDTVNVTYDESHVISDTDEGGPVPTLQDTWSGRRSRNDDYEPDTDEEHSNEEGYHQINGSDSDSDIDSASEFNWKEMGGRNGLEMDDLVDEDFQRIIANFGM
jgi:hypothetical protein